MEKCPIKRLAAKLVAKKIANRQALDAIDSEITAAIDAAVEFATRSEFPAIEEMYEDVYVSEGMAT
jgi:TPP-dependent pyruvate/acetoin dehydrogenase alpha subunit